MNRFTRKGDSIDHYIAEELRATVHVDHFAEYCESADVNVADTGIELATPQPIEE